MAGISTSALSVTGVGGFSGSLGFSNVVSATLVRTDAAATVLVTFVVMWKSKRLRVPVLPAKKNSSGVSGVHDTVPPLMTTLPRSVISSPTVPSLFTA